MTHTCKIRYNYSPCEACREEQRKAPRPVDLGRWCLRMGNLYRRFQDYGSYIIEECIDVSRGPYPYSMGTWDQPALLLTAWDCMVEEGWEAAPLYRYPNEMEGAQ